MIGDYPRVFWKLEPGIVTLLHDMFLLLMSAGAQRVVWRNSKLLQRGNWISLESAAETGWLWCQSFRGKKQENMHKEEVTEHRWWQSVVESGKKRYCRLMELQSIQTFSRKFLILFVINQTSETITLRETNWVLSIVAYFHSLITWHSDQTLSQTTYSLQF